jgi:hypothetical protein
MFADDVDTFLESIYSRQFTGESRDATVVDRINPSRTGGACKKAEDAGSGAEIQHAVAWLDYLLKSARERVETRDVGDPPAMVGQRRHYFFIRFAGIFASLRVLPPVCVSCATLPYSTSSGWTHGFFGVLGGEGRSD